MGPEPMVVAVAGSQIPERAGPLDPSPRRAMDGEVQVFVQDIIDGHGDDAAPQEWQAGQKLEPPDGGRMGSDDERALPPLKEDPIPIFCAGLEALVPAEDLVMKQGVRLVGRREHSPRAMHHPPVKGVLE